MRTRVMSGLLRSGDGEMDAEPVGLVFRRRPLLAEPQVEEIESARPQTHGADASVLLRDDHARVLEDAQMLHEG